MKQLGEPLAYIVTVTTRPRRPKEVDNVDYHFISNERFQWLVKHNQLLEWANVYGNYYGVPSRPIREALEKGQDAIAKVDVQGAATIKKLLPQAVFIFLMPPSMAELTNRLRKRLTESPDTLARRLKTAEKEIEQLAMFDYVVVNRQDEIDLAVAQIKAIITAEKCRVIPREISL